jgi:hypothetical protein
MPKGSWKVDAVKLTIQQNAVKMYVTDRNKAGEKVTVGQIAKAFKMSVEDVRYALKKIREERKSFSNFFEGMSDMFKGGSFK